MIDWYTARLGVPADALPQDEILRVAGLGGEVVWQKKVPTMVEAPSHDGRVALWAHDDPRWFMGWQLYWPPDAVDRWLDTARDKMTAKVLCFSGNPSKYLQGHNVVGPAAQYGYALVRDIVQSVAPKHNLVWPADAPFVPVVRYRADITQSVRVGSTQQEVDDWLMLAESCSRSRRGFTSDRGDKLAGTVYWQKHSRRWSMKAYSKFAELKARPLSCPRLQKRALEFACGLVRIELCLRRPELAEIGTLGDDLVWQYWGRLTMAKSKLGLLERSEELNWREARLLAAWRAGQDVKKGVNAPPRRTFARYKARILELTGDDISLPPPRRDADVVADASQLDEAWLRSRVEEGDGGLPIAEAAEPSLFSGDAEIR